MPHTAIMSTDKINNAWLFDVAVLKSTIMCVKYTLSHAIEIFSIDLVFRISFEAIYFPFNQGNEYKSKSVYNQLEILKSSLKLGQRQANIALEC